jgi:amino acid transporter
MFSRIIDCAVDCHFKKDRSGRLVFIPFTLKGKCYFVDSKSDEEKLRGLVRLFRSTLTLISWLSFPSIYLPGLILDGYAGLTPRGHRLAIALGIPLFFWAILGTLAAALWFVYKDTVPRVTASLSEVGPEVKGQLREISRRPARIALGLALACLGLLILMIVGVLGWQHSRNKCPCPAKVQAGQKTGRAGGRLNPA